VDRSRARSLFAPLIAAPGRAVVACDYDGTLAPMAPRPDLAAPEPGAVDALAALAPALGRLAVITGRAAADAVALGGLDRVAGLVVLGLYGAQRWDSGRLSGAEVPTSVRAARAELLQLLADGLGGPGAVGAWIEDKGGSFGLHVRAAADPDAALAELADPVDELADRYGLMVERGRLVLELRPPGIDKGVALRALVDELGTAPSAVLFLGDDLGDLPAFAAVRDLRAVGVQAWGVASASAEAPEVGAAADIVVDGPAGVVALLRALADELSAP
jgi:trehalose 6-phosphate phosphatase